MIRDATREDYPVLESMCQSFWNSLDFDEEYEQGSSEMYLDIALSQNLLFVYESDNKIKGFVAGCMIPLMGSKSTFSGTEQAWWVDPYYRGTTIGARLKKHIEKAAKNLGCKYWNMVALESSMPQEIKAMYEKDGYRVTETTYMKRLT